MKKSLKFSSLIIALCVLLGGTSVQGQEGTPVLRITAVPDGVPRAFRVFDQHVDVFGVHIFASSNVPADKVLHAAGVMAQYLDNDADGQPDNRDVVAAMVESGASMVMFNRESEREEDELFESADELFDQGIELQPLYGFEVHPNGAEEGEFDATLEEVLHLITHAGYAVVYPDVWGEYPGTAIADAVDAARGGHFVRVPAQYPSTAWYTYDDRTCDYGCQITEYIYWSLTSILGAQNYPGRFEEIRHEWRLNTPELVQSRDSTVYSLLTDPEYRLPTVLPDGDYRPHPESE